MMRDDAKMETQGCVRLGPAPRSGTLERLPIPSTPTPAACDPAAVDDYMDGVRAIARSKGVRLTVESDFAALKAATMAAQGRPPLPCFDPEHHEVTADNAFWIKGVSDADEIVSLQAARIDDLRGLTLADWLERMWAFYRDPARDAGETEICVSGAFHSRCITDRVVYHGEFWLKPGKGGFRGLGLSAVIPRLGLALALRKWQPDFAYGIVWPAVAERGIPRFYGYPHAEPNGALWNWHRRAGLVEGHLVWMDLQELVAMTQRPGERPQVSGAAPVKTERS